MKYFVSMMVVALALSFSACASTPERQAAVVADYGTKLLDAVKVAQDAVIQAEAKGALPTNKARESMLVFQKIGDTSQQLANELRLYAALDPGSQEASTKVEVVVNYLNALDSLVIDAIVPIDNAEVRGQVSALLKHVSSLLLTIQTQVLQ